MGLSQYDYIPCEKCGNEAKDVHHLTPRGAGGSRLLDTPENLMGLCREHHEMCEADKTFNEEMRALHLEKLSPH